MHIIIIPKNKLNWPECGTSAPENKDCLCGKNNPDKASTLNVMEPALHSPIQCKYIEDVFTISSHYMGLNSGQKKAVLNAIVSWANAEFMRLKEDQK